MLKKERLENLVVTGQIEKMNLRVIKKEKLINDQIEDEAVIRVKLMLKL